MYICMYMCIYTYVRGFDSADGGDLQFSLSPHQNGPARHRRRA